MGMQYLENRAIHAASFPVIWLDFVCQRCVTFVEASWSLLMTSLLFKCMSLWVFVYPVERTNLGRLALRYYDFHTTPPW